MWTYFRNMWRCLASRSSCKFHYRNTLGLPSNGMLQEIVFLTGLVCFFRINVDLAIFKPYPDLEAGDNNLWKFKWRGRESNVSLTWMVEGLIIEKVGWLVCCIEDLRRFEQRYFNHIATLKQEITNLWNSSGEAGNRTPNLLLRKPRA